MTKSDFVLTYPMEKPLSRLILIGILMDGEMSGEGERIITHDRLAQFCCCSKQALFRELNILEADGFIAMRKMFSVDDAGKVTTHPQRGYTLLQGGR